MVSAISLSRAILVSVQAYCNYLASTPPNKSPNRGRYDASHPWYLKIAPLIMILQVPIVCLCTFADIILILSQNSLLSFVGESSTIQSTICPFPPNNTRAASTAPQIRLTLLSLLGFSFVIFGTALRITCFRHLGTLFTFDLAIMPSHKLVTSGPYAYVRHPAYTGSLCLMFGLGLANLSEGSWIFECGLLGRGALGYVVRALVFVVWWSWWLSVGFHRSRAEDGELKKKFGQEWEMYAKRVNAWFVPGVL